MARYNPVGLVRMNMFGMSEDAFIAHAKKARYLASVVIDANHMARRLHDEAGVLYPVSRIYPFEPRPDNDNPAHVKAYAAARYQDLKNLRADAKSPNVLYYVNNERGFVKRDFMMYCELIKLSVADPAGPIGLCFWNGASGAVMTGFWNQSNQWKEPWAIEFLKLMHEHRNVRLPSGAYAFILGTHNYTSQYALIAVNAGRDRKRKGEPGNLWDKHNAYLTRGKRIDWRLAQDHIGRDYQGIMFALGYAVSADGTRFEPTDATLRDSAGKPVLCPWLLITEAVYDNMNDVRDTHRDELIPMAAGVPAAVDTDFVPMSTVEQFRVASTGILWLLWTLVLWLETLWRGLAGVFVSQSLDTPRGYRSLAKTWEQASWFPGRPAGYINAYSLLWAHHVIHAPTEVTIAQVNYCEGQTSTQWVSYNVRGDGDYLAFMESDAAQVEIPAHFIRAGTPPVEPPPPPSTDPTLPKKNDGRWFKSNVAAYPERVYIYARRDEASAKLGYIQSASATDYSQQVWTIYNPRLGRWRAVMLDNGVIGWVDETLIDFKPDTPPFNITAQDERWRRHNVKVIGTLPVNVRERVGEGAILKAIQPGPSTGLDIIPLSMLVDHERSFLERGSEVGAIDYYVVKLINDGRIGFVGRSFLEVAAAITVTIPQHEYLQLKADLELAEKRADALAFDLMAEQDAHKATTRRLDNAQVQALELQTALQIAPGALIAEVRHLIGNHLMPAKLLADNLVSDLTEKETD